MLAHIVDVARSEAIAELTVHASHTARGFFESSGFVVEEECTPVIGRARLTNFFMRRTLPGSGAK